MTGRPEMPRPDIVRADMARPETASPETARPETERPQMPRSEMVRPETERSEMARLAIGCCAETDEPNWRWVADAVAGEPADWTFFSNVPQNAIERLVTRPRLSRYRACRGLAAGARRGLFDLIVTHHPLVSFWTEFFCRSRGRRTCPHVAFAFNFTRLPRGLRRFFMRRAFARIERFVVFSQFERSLYAEYFGIPLERFEMVYWGVREPVDTGAGTPSAGSPGAGGVGLSAEGGLSRTEPPKGGSTQTGPLADAICAVGSQGRDYRTLLEAMRRLPHIRLVVVATAANLRGLSVPANVPANVTVRLDVPPNVTVRLDVPRPEAEAVIRESRFLVLPLVNSEVPCGHVTLVTAMYASRAIVATDSRGLSDYVRVGHNGLTVPAGDAGSLASAIERLWQDRELATRLGKNGREWALAHCTESRTIEYVRELVTRVRTTGRP